MDVEVRHLRLVSAVADLGSLTKAGERLHLTQSALSHQLRDIEARLGTPLFLRIGKRLVLTPAGTRLLASAREVLDRLQQAEDDIRQLGRDRAGVLRITTECYTCYHWLPPLLTRYRRRFPRVEVRIDVDATSRPMPSLFDGKIDLAIVSSPVSDRRLVLRPIFQDELLVVVSPAHRLAGRPRVRLVDLRDETMFVYPPKEECRYLQQVLAPAGVPARVEEMQLTEAITELVKANFGFSVLARWAVQPLLDAGTLVALPIASRGLRRHWSAAMPKALAAVDYVQEFVALLTRHAPARPGVNAASSAGISRNGARRADRRAS